MSPGEKALEALRLLLSAHNLGDFVNSVRDSELKGWDGPRVTAWCGGANLADEALKEAGIVVVEIGKEVIPAPPAKLPPLSLPPGYVLPNFEGDGFVACMACGAQVVVTKGALPYGACLPAGVEGGLMDVNKLPGIDFDELRKCDGCGGGLMGKGPHQHLNFYRVTVENAVVMPRAVDQFRGLAMMLGGNEQLANVFAPERHAAKVLDAGTFFLCFDCHPMELHSLMEKRAKAEETPA